MKWPRNITLCEVGPRDGLQNEAARLSTEEKIKWIDSLTDSGFSFIEVSSFVSPKWIPALADAEEVLQGIRRQPGVVYSALVPNERGLERALRAKVDAVAVFMSASESHNKSNINKTIEETFPVLRPVIDGAKQENLPVRGYVSTVFGCPYEGEVDPNQVVKVATKLLEDGVDEISLGDTIGVSTPTKTARVLEAVLKEIPLEKIALHMHDTRGTALANIMVGLEYGITRYDSALGGLGGCPYAPGAAGNVATDDLVYLFKDSDVETGVSREKMNASLELLEQLVKHTLPSHTSSYLRSRGWKE